MQFSHFIGIDISKNSLDIAVLKGRDLMFSMIVENSVPGIRSFMKEFKRSQKCAMSEVVLCMEHIGIYADRLLEELHKRRCNIWLENPLHIKRSLGIQRGKSDKIDAHRIALYAYKNRDEVRLWQPPREIITKLGCLVRLRARLVQSRQSLAVPVQESKKSAKASTASLVARFSRRSLTVLKDELKKVDLQILNIIREDPYLKRLFEIVSSVPGVGPVTGIAIILATNEFRTITSPKKFACYAGVAPFEHRSGTSVKGRTRVSHIANKRIKKLLHLAAITALRGKNELREYFDRKVGDGKHKMLVFNAVRNKIIHRVFACVNQDRLYRKNIQILVV